MQTTGENHFFKVRSDVHYYWLRCTGRHPRFVEETRLYVLTNKQSDENLEDGETLELLKLAQKKTVGYRRQRDESVELKPHMLAEESGI